MPGPGTCICTELHSVNTELEACSGKELGVCSVAEVWLGSGMNPGVCGCTELHSGSSTELELGACRGAYMDITMSTRASSSELLPEHDPWLCAVAWKCISLASLQCQEHVAAQSQGCALPVTHQSTGRPDVMVLQAGQATCLTPLPYTMLKCLVHPLVVVFHWLTFGDFTCIVCTPEWFYFTQTPIRQ